MGSLQRMAGIGIAVVLGVVLLAGQTASDQGIQASVIRRLQNENLRRGSNPEVTVSSGTVTLTGQLRNLWEKEATIEVVRKTDGVVTTISELTILKAESDRAIADELTARVLRYDRYSLFDDISATVRDGMVLLQGNITDMTKARDIRDLAAHISGVQAVQNDLKQYPALQSDDRVRDALARQIFLNPTLLNYGTQANPSIHLVVAYGKVTLKGFVRSAQDRQQVETIARLVPGVLSVSNELQVSR